MVTQHPHQVFQLLVQLSFITRIHKSTRTSKLTESKWERLCQQHDIRVEYSEHASIISESTCVIQQTIQQLLQQVNDRENVLDSMCKYYWALGYVAMMREIALSSSLGYLPACDVYSNQCRHKAVIDMCTKELVVMEKDDADNNKIKTIKNKSKDISSK